ncbi:MAG: glycine cleavage system aminomethyltransferase GcvT [Pseudomonadales bacterium]
MTDGPTGALRRTALYDLHVAAGAKMVPFAGWEMPLNYGSQIVEHNAVRTAVGMFDVSHMTVVDVTGAGAHGYLQRLVANDVARLKTHGKALYGVLLNEAAGVIDDLIVYRHSEAEPLAYRVVVNAGTRDKVLAWFERHAGAEVQVREQDLAMIAVQGPEAVARFEAVSGWQDLTALEPFSALSRGDWMVARTGYTGEDGVEVILPGAEAQKLWSALAAAGVQPAGLAARDTLRLEAGLNLYGQDMDESTNPLESNLGWTIAWQPEARAFIGRDALAALRAAGVGRRLTGLVLEGRGVIRGGQRVVTGAGDGVVTSGIFSPTLGYSIALARVPKDAQGECQVEVRGKLLPVRIVKPPFVRNGQKVFE